MRRMDSSKLRREGHYWKTEKERKTEEVRKRNRGEKKREKEGETEGVRKRKRNRKKEVERKREVILIEKARRFAPRGVMRKFEISHTSSHNPLPRKKNNSPVVITD